MIRRLLSFFARYGDASRLCAQHAAAATISRSGRKGCLVARHQAYVLFHERLRRGV